MPDMSVYKPCVKVLIAMSAEQLTTKTEKFIDELIDQGVDSELIYISPPTIATGYARTDYVICHTVTYHIPLAK